MVNYQNGKIYKLVCNITGLIYIGSTCEKLSNRLAEHKKKSKLYLEGKGNYISSFKIIDNGNYDIILIEDYACERREQLHSRERYWIEQFECVNMRIPTHTKKEYYQTNKIEIRQKNKTYCENNEEKIKEIKKEYYQRNINEITKYKKHHYQTNKDEINEKRKEKMTCECGRIIKKSDKARHLRTKLHNELIEKFNNNNV